MFRFKLPYPPLSGRALIALYNSTNGDRWSYNNNWKTPPLDTDGFAMPGTESTWAGITVSGDSVTEISLYTNNMYGTIPAELGNLTNLEQLDLEGYDNMIWRPMETYEPGNNVIGTIPAELGNLSNLIYLNIAGNGLSGAIPRQLGNLSKLVSLELADNQLTHTIPAKLGNLGNLVSLELADNQLTGSIPAELGNLGNLESLGLGNNPLSGTIPTELGNLSNLSSLTLRYCGLSGTIPLSLINLPKIDSVSVSGNYLTIDDPAIKAWLDDLDVVWRGTQCHPPFGSFDSPLDNSTVAGSIAVTGWALDNNIVESVKIYREENNQLLYLGDAVFIEGARWDVAASYSGYHNNTKAGWGYMMLTNFLPNGGNGPVVLHAIATNAFGKTYTLGTKTITCDNANAVKPFGAIDTPSQGGSASGKGFINWGWALTPQPNSIATDGSTINVWVDGVNIGNPVYNIFRNDIAGLFPGYANSNGAIGYFYLDTTAYADGVHTIQWTAKDSGGNSDGIGSRYFTIQNTGARKSSAAHAKRGISDICNKALKDFSIAGTFGVKIKKGFIEDSEALEIFPDDKGVTKVETKELERLELDFSNCMSNYSQISGYMKVAGKFFPLPVGSTLTVEGKKFYWQPGPGFIGEYRFVFIEKEQGKIKSRKDMVVKIVPKFQ